MPFMYYMIYNMNNIIKYDSYYLVLALFLLFYVYIYVYFHLSGMHI